MSATQTQPMAPSTHDVDAIVRTMDETGYCLIPGVISPQHADEARSILEGFLAQERNETNRRACHQRVAKIALKHRVFLDLMCHELIVSIWKKFLGEDVICSTWTGNTIYPGNSSYHWHADFPYWALALPWPTGNLAGQTIWMLDDFTDENGGTGVVPYSHRKLHPPPDRDKWRDDAKIVTGVRGSVMVAHGAFWHTSRPNRTDRPRSALLGMYMRPCLVTQEDMRGQLAQLKDASPIARQLLGEKQYQPKDVLPY